MHNIHGGSHIDKQFTYLVWFNPLRNLFHLIPCILIVGVTHCAAQDHLWQEVKGGQAEEGADQQPLQP